MRSTVSMQRLRVAAVVLLAVILAAQLTLHNHALIPEGGASPALACSVCAFGADRPVVDTPLAGVFLVFLGLLFLEADAGFASVAPVPRTGRAPPRPR